MTNTTNGKNFNKFIDSFDILGTGVKVSFDHRRILVDREESVSVYEPVKKFAFIIAESTEDDGTDTLVVDFYLKEFNNRSKVYWAAGQYNVGLMYFEDSKQLVLSSPNRQDLLDFIIDERFPTDAVPNYDPTLPQKEVKTDG